MTLKVVMQTRTCLRLVGFVHGPVALRPSFVGKATTFATSIVLLVIAFKTLLQISWPAPLAFEWSVRFIYSIIGANILYLIKRAREITR